MDDPNAAALSDGLDLEAPDRGLQVSSRGVVVEAGDTEQWCEVIQLPGGPSDAYYVNRIEAQMSPRAQRLVVSAAIPGSDTEAAMTAGDRVPCVRAGEAFGEELVEVLSTQRAYASVELPESVGRIFFGGQKLVVDLRHASGTETPSLARARINLHRVDADSIQHLARTAVFNNLTIYTPPQGRSSHVGECTFDRDVTISALSRQTQRQGRAFKVWFAGGARDGELIWTSHHWLDQTRYTFRDGPVTLRAGEGFRFQCDFENTTDHDLRFGSGDADEQCVLSSTFWLTDEDSDPSDIRCLLLGRDVAADGIARK